MNVDSGLIGRDTTNRHAMNRNMESHLPRPRRRDVIRIALTAALFLAGTIGIALPPAQTGTFYSDEQPFVPGAMRDVRATSTPVDDINQGWTTTSTVAGAATATNGDAPPRDEKAYVAATRRCALAQSARARELCE